MKMLWGIIMAMSVVCYGAQAASLMAFGMVAPQEEAITLQKQVIQHLQNSGMATIRQMYVEGEDVMALNPSMEKWRNEGLSWAVVAQLHEEKLHEDIQWVWRMRVWNVTSGEQVLARAYRAGDDESALIADTVADDLYGIITGEEGYFAHRIMSVAADDEGSRLTFTGLSSLREARFIELDERVVSARAIDGGRRIVCVIHEEGMLSLHVYDVEKEEMTAITEGDDMSFAPRIFADGTIVLFARSSWGNSDVYHLDMSLRVEERLTSHSAIDLPGGWDGQRQRLVFSSHRGGTPQLYTMAHDGSDLRRLTFAEGDYFTPVWSPRGDDIAFVRCLEDGCQLATIMADGSDMRVRQNGIFFDHVSWSAGGNALLFTQLIRDGSDDNGDERRVIRVLNVDSGAVYDVESGDDVVRDVSWSASP